MFFKKVVNDALIRVTTFLIKESFLGLELNINLMIVNDFYYNYPTCLKKTRKITRDDQRKLLLSLLENIDEKELKIHEAVKNANQPIEAIRIMEK